MSNLQSPSRGKARVTTPALTDNMMGNANPTLERAPAQPAGERSVESSWWSRLSKTTVNFVLDCALLAVFMVLLWIAVVLRFVFPPGPDAAGWTLWQMNYVQWREFEFVVLCLLTLGILVHVMLHWTWVCGVVANALAKRSAAKRSKLDDGTRTLIGVGTLIVILHVLAIGVAAAWFTVRPPF